MVKEKILLIEDDKHISQLVKYNLEKSGYHCLSVLTGEEALDLLVTETVGLIILDIMLPKMDGFEVCKALRQDAQTADVPVIMLTARGEEVDRVVGLELGADDYMVKPFSPRELVLRVKAILRRAIAKPIKGGKDFLTAGAIVLDRASHKVLVKKKEIFLTAIEFKLLATLLERRGRVQSREILLEDVWGISSEVTTRTIDSHVKSLRQKLGKQARMIRTVRGIGYKLVEEMGS